MSKKVLPFCLKDAPALIERLLPVQKLSAEAFREQEGKQSKVLTGLGSYWKGRKPLVLNRACVLGCLLPATSNTAKDLEVFEMLMGMDERSLAVRIGGEEDAIDIVRSNTYRKLIETACRPDEAGPEMQEHIWVNVNEHLGTRASSLPELIQQLGIMRFGRVPMMADAFSGSGQIPFEAARLGCQVVASDLNPIACMLTWGSFNIIGGAPLYRDELREAQAAVAAAVQTELDSLGVESDGKGWRPKTMLYCLEVSCPETGWKVPVLPTRLISKGRKTVAELVSNPTEKRFDIRIVSGVSQRILEESSRGTLVSDGKGQESYLEYCVNGVNYRRRMSTIRGDFTRANGSAGNKLRQWDQLDFHSRKTDVFRERLYCIQWMRQKKGSARFDYQFRAVSEGDVHRELIVEKYVSQNIAEWQKNGWIPDLRIEPGDETERLYRERGWTHWHHLFSPRQLLFLGLTIREIRTNHANLAEPLSIFTARLADWSSKLCRYGTGAARESVAQTFYNQALNTLYSYAVRSFFFAKTYLLEDVQSLPIAGGGEVRSGPSAEFTGSYDLIITDPPYGDAVKYEEILEFFIAWLRKSPPPAFSSWTWDSRRSLAIRGEGEGFRQGMCEAYKNLNQCLVGNGLQVLMFTHQSGSLWADMANIVWAAGMQVTAAWYVVTETDSALREGSYIKGTVLLVLRKRDGLLKASRDDLGYEIQEEVEKQIGELTGLNQAAKGMYRDANVFEDADVQMAGYAAALRVLTRYAVIDGKDMPAEALRPRVKGETTFVDKLITFAVDTANQCLVPEGLNKAIWDAISGPERFYLKLLELEAKGVATLDNYQNFAKAFKVADFHPLMASAKANKGSLRGAKEFKATEMGEGSQLYQSPLRCMLYAMKELMDETDGDDVIKHLALNVPSYYEQATRDVILAVADYLAAKLERLRPDEASSARVLRDLVRNQRIG